MKKDYLKKSIVSLALTGSFILAIGAFNSANAQGRQRRINPTPRGGQIESTGNIDRNYNGIDDRYEANGQVDINQNGIPDSSEGYNRNGRNNRGYNGNNGWYGNSGYGVNNSEFQRGYRDGLNYCRENTRANRAMTLNNSSHYRRGNQGYRAGFERAFNEAYRQNSGRRW